MSGYVMQICLSFYEVKNKQGSWFSKQSERLYWEHWYISLNVSQQPKVHSVKSHNNKVVDTGGMGNYVNLIGDALLPHLVGLQWIYIFFNAENILEETSTRRASLEASLRDVLFQIIRFVNDKKEHIPPIPNREGVVSFPYEIALPRSVDLVFQPRQTKYEFISVLILDFQFINEISGDICFLIGFVI